MTQPKLSTVRKGRRAVEKTTRALQRLVVEYLPIGDVRENPYNPNRQDDHEFTLLQKSMEEDGFTQPVIITPVTEEHLADPKFHAAADFRVGALVIVDGAHRWRAARLLGYQEIPVVRVDMGIAQMRIATLRHNRARGSEDLQLSVDVLRDLQTLGALEWAQDSLGLDDLEIQRLIEDIPAPDALAGESFGQAWAPKTSETVALEQDVVEGQDRAVALTPSAGDALRTYETRVAAAKTEEERQAARRDANVYRLVLVYTAQEAESVRSVLEPQPALKVLHLCQLERQRTAAPAQPLAVA
ncbi:MAG: ParB N-terminal domain-containing protein, partial [Dehalococcoidia bacterium]